MGTTSSVSPIFGPNLNLILASKSLYISFHLSNETCAKEIDWAGGRLRFLTVPHCTVDSGTIDNAKYIMIRAF